MSSVDGTAVYPAAPTVGVDGDGRVDYIAQVGGSVTGARPTVGDMVRVARPRSGNKAHEVYLNQTGRIIKDLEDNGYGQPYQIEGMTSNQFADDIYFCPDELEGGGGIAMTPSYGSYGVYGGGYASSIANSSYCTPPTQIQRIERIIEVPVVQTVERIVEVPEVQIDTVDRQVPKIITQEVVRQQPVIQKQTQERIVEVPQIIVTERIVEIPQVQIQIVTREVPKVITQEVIKNVPKIIEEVREIVVEVPEIKTIERVVDIPQMQVQIVDRQVPKIITQEVVRQVPKISIQTQERLVEVPQVQTIERIVEVPQIQVEEVIREVDVPQTIYAEPVRTCQRVAATPAYSGDGSGIVRTASHGLGGVSIGASPTPYTGGGVLGSSTIM